MAIYMASPGMHVLDGALLVLVVLGIVGSGIYLHVLTKGQKR